MSGMVLPVGLLQADPLAPWVSLRWELLLVAAALLAIYLVFRERGDLPRAMGFTRADVGLLTLGAVAGQVLSVPLFPVGDALFGINLGGALIPIILSWRLARRGTVPPWAALVGIGAVAAATYPFVSVEPGRGAIVAFPWFLLPALVAVLAGVILGLAEPIRAGPLAFISGSLGTLVGADVLRLPAFLDVAREASPGTAMIIGGGGLLDLIFLTGVLGLATSLGLSLVQRPPVEPPGDPTAPPRRVPAPRALVDRAEALPGLSARERCQVHLARADVALASDHLVQATEEAHRAIEVLLDAGTPPLSQRIEAAPPPALVQDLDLLARRAQAANRDHTPWHEALDSIELAKALAGALWDEVEPSDRLGGGQR